MILFRKNKVQVLRAPKEEGRFSTAWYPLSIERGWNSGYPTSTPLHRGLMLAACEPGRRGLQVAKRRAGEKRETRAGKQTATRAPRETVRVPSSARQGSVRVLLLARTLQEHPPQDRPRDNRLIANCFTPLRSFSIISIHPFRRRKLIILIVKRRNNL